MADLPRTKRGQEVQIISETTQKDARVEDFDNVTDGSGLRVYIGSQQYPGFVRIVGGSSTDAIIRSQYNEILPILQDGDYENLQLDRRGRLITSMQDSTKKSIDVGREGSFVLQAAYDYIKFLEYTIPDQYIFELTSITSTFGDARIKLRYSKTRTLGIFNYGNPGTYTQYTQNNYEFPIFGGMLEGEIDIPDTNIDNIKFTATYTNQDGISGRTSTTGNVKKGWLQGTKFTFPLQGNDIGIRSVQNITANKAATGRIKINGVVPFLLVQDSTKSYVTSTIFPARQSIIIESGETYVVDVGTSANLTQFVSSIGYGLIVQV